jgi:hypothetical protein
VVEGKKKESKQLKKSKKRHGLSSIPEKGTQPSSPDQKPAPPTT